MVSEFICDCRFALLPQQWKAAEKQFHTWIPVQEIVFPARNALCVCVCCASVRVAMKNHHIISRCDRITCYSRWFQHSLTIHSQLKTHCNLVVLCVARIFMNEISQLSMTSLPLSVTRYLCNLYITRCGLLHIILISIETAHWAHSHFFIAN